jgi:Protein of unknown function (DUF4019)
MRLVRCSSVVLGAVLVILSVAGLAQEKPAEVAQRSDEVWLALTDTGKYAESWKTAGEAFQVGVTEEKWESAMRSVRLPMGKLRTRKVQSAVYSTTLQGAPDGEYVVAHFETRFEHKQAAVETVVSTREKDGVWRVVGYFIK